MSSQASSRRSRLELELDAKIKDLSLTPRQASSSTFKAWLDFFKSSPWYFSSPWLVATSLFLSKDEKDNFDSSFNTSVKSMSLTTSKKSQIDENVFDVSRFVNRFRNENDTFVVEKNQTHIQTYVRLSANESRIFNYSSIIQSSNTVSQFDEQSESNSLNTREISAKKVIYSLLIKSNLIVVSMNSTLQAVIIVVVNVVVIQTINDIRAKIRQEMQ